MRPSKSRSQRRPLHMSRRFQSLFGCAACIGVALFAGKGLSYRTAEASAPAPSASAGEDPKADISAAGAPAAGTSGGSVSVAHNARLEDDSVAASLTNAGASDAEPLLVAGSRNIGREDHQIVDEGKAEAAVIRAGVASERASADSIAATASVLVPDAADDLADMQTSVRQLMLLETHHALMRSKGGTSSGPGSSSRPQSASSSTREGPHLRAIYGVGQRLLAEVAIGSETLIFLKGHPVPMGYKAGAAPYRLTDWDKHCIQLEVAAMHPQRRSRAIGGLPTERIDLESAKVNRGAPPRDEFLVENLSLCLRPQAGKG